MLTRNRFLVILLALFLLAGSGMTLAALVIPNAKTLLTQSLESLTDIREGHLVAEFELDSPQQTAAGSLEAWGKLDAGPDGEPAFRVTILTASEPGLVGLTAVSDGSQFWLYHPAENKVVTGNWADLKEQAAALAADHDHDWDSHDWDRQEWADRWDDWEGGFAPDFAFDWEEIDFPETAEEAVAMLLDYFNASRTGTADIGDNRAHVIRLVPIADQMPAEVRAAGGYLNVWVRTGDSAPLGLEYVQGVPGSFRLAATTLTLNEALPDEIFTFAIPDGAEVVPFDELEMPDKENATAEFEPLTLTTLPEGTVELETAVIRGATVTRYQLDGAEFYLAQGPATAAADLFGGERGEALTVRGQAATLYLENDGDRLLLTWRENGVTLWLGGQLNLEQALALADALE